MPKNIKQDEMTPKERMAAFIAGQKTDRIPCSPFLGETCAPMLGVSIKDYYTSWQMMSSVEVELFKRFKPDRICVGISMRDMAEAMGAEIIYPENDIAYGKKALLADYHNVDKLKRIDPLRDGRIPLILKALLQINQAIGSQVDVESGIVGAFTIASFIRGPENLLLDLMTNPEAVHGLLDVITENNLRYIDTVSALGFNVEMSDPFASESVIGVNHFREFAKPHLTACNDRIKAWIGRGSSLHICGKSKNLWLDMAECGIESLSIDNIENLAEAKKIVGDKVGLIGNVDPINVMLTGTINDVYQAVEKCIEEAGDSPKGYLISTGCQVPVNTPEKNIQAMMDAARIYGLH